MQNRKYPSLDNDCTLIKEQFGTDDIGNDVASKEEFFSIFCAEISVSQSEFFAAGRMDFKPEYVLIAQQDDYNNEKAALYNNEKYSIYRTYKRDDDLVELYLRKE